MGGHVQLLEATELNQKHIHLQIFLEELENTEIYRIDKYPVKCAAAMTQTLLNGEKKGKKIATQAAFRENGSTELLITSHNYHEYLLSLWQFTV